MFFNILKKDLKCGRTMNIIILLFIILSVTFISGSANSIVSVTRSLDNFFDKAGVADLTAATIDKAQTVDFEKILEKDSALYNKIEHEDLMLVDSDAETIRFKDGSKINYSSSFLLESFDTLKEKFFTEDNEELKSVEKGEIYIVHKLLSQTNMKVGDSIIINIGDAEKEFKIAGTFKDAILGSVLAGNGRLVINEEDAKDLYTEAQKIGETCKMYMIHTDSAEELENRLNELDVSFILLVTRDYLKSAYIMDMVVAIILLIVSLILIVIALIVLRFTISFTLASEFREIGVMKAIGISNMKIRLLYLAKYFAISVVGAIIGSLLSIPFGKLLVSVSGQSILVESNNGIILSLLCAAFVVVIIMLFGLLCTKKANRLSPIDAIRNGQTGERFRKKGLLHLSKSKMGATTFMAGNDVLSAPKRYLIIIVVFALSILPIQLLDILASSLATKEMLSNVSIIPSDVCFTLSDNSYLYTTDGSGKEKLQKILTDTEKKLEENGMPARVYCEIMLISKEEFNGNITKVLALQGVNNRAYEHKYTKGSAPKSPDEVALHPNTAKKLGADIGDVIKVSIGDKTYDLMVSGFFEAMLNMGQAIRVHEDLYADYNYSNGSFGFQIAFKDNPDEKEIKRRIEKLHEIIPNGENFQTGAEMAEDFTSVGPMFNKIKKLFLILSIVIVIMVAVLMERSMVIKETAEIATLKAIGFTDGKVIKWHAKRFIITAVISAVIAGILAMPLTKLFANPVFSYMGVSQGVKYSINIARVCVFYPLLLMVFMTLSVWITASRTRTITAQQTSCTE